ncbi:helix-turn-helix domain-containing protein [Paenibacillus chartarius]|uniref:Helix-turn-helix domain-containing protein n=1 Tax=Paenibacillus chartarius TaxID=747481 RepID=A0ABV6DSC9_9BACL
MRPVIALRRKSVIVTWMLSYLAVLLLPLIVSVFVYIVASRTLESQIHEANGSLLKQVREMMDSYFQAMERLNFELTWNVRMQELLYSNKYLSHPEEYNYDLYQISQDMRDYEKAYTFIDKFYTFLNRDQLVIWPSLVRDGAYAYKLLHVSSGAGYDAWLETLNRRDYLDYLPLVRIDDSGVQHNTVALISSYTMDKNSSPATNVIMIDQDRILNSIRNVELFNKGHVFILSPQNEVLVSNSAVSLTDALPFDRFTDELEPLYYWKIGDKRYEVTAIVSSRSGLKYVSMIPSNLYWEKAELVRNLTIASAGVSLLGGALLMTFFLRRNYNPLRNLMHAVSGNADVPLPGAGNEFQLLEQAIHRTFTKLDSMSAQIDRQRQLVRSHFIGRLLKGRADTAGIPIEESLAAFHMAFASDEFAVIVLAVEPSEAFDERLSHMDPAAKRMLLMFIVTNVVEELASQRNIGYVAEVDDVFACLVNLRQNGEENRGEELMRIASEAQRFLAESYGIQLTLAVSGIHRTASGIAQAYVEALDALEYKLVMGSKEILSYEELQRRISSAAGPESEVGYYYPLQVEQQLINYAKVGDFEKAKRTLDDIIEINFRRTPAVSVPIARCLTLNLVSTMIKTVSEIGSLQDSFLVQNPRRIERLTQFDTVQEMQRQTTEFLRQVCEYTAGLRQQHLQQSRQQALDELVREVKELIGSRYSDPNLNISMIGHAFDMKPTYLSKLFKDHTGEGLLDCINKTRVEQAKRIMAEDGQSVTDAAGLVGFNDVNAFIRTFKKYEGITPGKFKEAAEAQS